MIDVLFLFAVFASGQPEPRKLPHDVARPTGPPFSVPLIYDEGDGRVQPAGFPPPGDAGGVSPNIPRLAVPTSPVEPDEATDPSPVRSEKPSAGEPAESAAGPQQMVSPMTTWPFLVLLGGMLAFALATAVLSLVLFLWVYRDRRARPVPADASSPEPMFDLSTESPPTPDEVEEIKRGIEGQLRAAMGEEAPTAVIKWATGVASGDKRTLLLQVKAGEDAASLGFDFDLARLRSPSKRETLALKTWSLLLRNRSHRLAARRPLAGA